MGGGGKQKGGYEKNWGVVVEGVGGGLTVNGGSVTNTGTLKATTTGTLGLENLTVTNSVGPTNGTVQVDANSFLDLEKATIKVGRASCRERGEISGGAGSFKKKKITECG